MLVAVFTDKLSHMDGSVENSHPADGLGTSALGVQMRLEGEERELSLRARRAGLLSVEI